ncbi:MAG: cobalamin-independent methionine synthase II family protein [Gammaproteobacteria bacterium]|nr:cobalamin-independent methionine synthase II family protein [Gammaproteobacteria bacterium]
MKRSTDRILTTHVGSLPRPPALIEAFRQRLSGEQLEQVLRDAIDGVVSKQAEIGIDVVNDGEFGKPMSEETDYGAWATYIYDRLAGYELREMNAMDNPLGVILGESKDWLNFREFYEAGGGGVEEGRKEKSFVFPVNTGAVSYTGHNLIQRDIGNFKSALGKVNVTDNFMSAAFTGVQVGPSEYYQSNEEQAVAIAEAMRDEYRAITAAGLNVQIDDPILVNIYEMFYSKNDDVAGFRKWAKGHVDLLNHSLEGVPLDQVRYHLCWGSWHGPHSADIPMKDVIDLMLQINSSQYSFEAANPRHEHEWKVWKDVKLPEGKAIIPGVVTHKTSVLEHPETVADRIVRFANIVGRENVIASTDCGFGGRLHPQLAWAKLASLVEGAKLASEQLW